MWLGAVATTAKPTMTITSTVTFGTLTSGEWVYSTCSNSSPTYVTLYIVLKLGYLETNGGDWLQTTVRSVWCSWRYLPELRSLRATVEQLLHGVWAISVFYVWQRVQVCLHGCTQFEWHLVRGYVDTKQTRVAGLVQMLHLLFEDFHDYAGPFGADYAHARYGHSATMIAPDVLLLFGGCLR